MSLLGISRLYCGDIAVNLYQAGERGEDVHAGEVKMKGKQQKRVNKMKQKGEHNQLLHHESDSNVA